MEMMLQTQNLCKYFRKQKAVNNVSLNIEKGQIYGLLGNGGGASEYRVSVAQSGRGLVYG